MKINYAGIALIGLFVAACSGGSDSRPLTVNAAPTIAAIADQNSEANKASQPISFSVTDEQVDSLSYSFMSDNQQIVPDDGIALAGSGASRSIVVTPVFDSVGDAFVTIIVTDSGGLSASSTFLLTILAEQQSMQLFTRSEFAETGDEDPSLVNAVDFAQDADDDDFADLLTQ